MELKFFNYTTERVDSFLNYITVNCTVHSSSILKCSGLLHDWNGNMIFLKLVSW